MNEEIERAWWAYEQALKGLGRAKKAGAENTYGAAYQRLVVLGAVPQIRGKYRGR